MPDTIPAVVGRNLRSYREHFGLTLAEVSKAARDNGVKWSTGRLTQVEKGEGAATVELLVVLALTLSDLSGFEVSPLDFLATNDPVRIGGKAANAADEVPPLDLTAAAFHAILAGEKHEVFPPDMPQEAQEALHADIVEGVKRSAVEYGTDVTFEQIEEARKAWSLTDERAARKLGIGPKTFTGQCIRVWGHLLSVEVEARSDPGDSPQKRGRVTRVLLDELRRSIHGND